MKNYINKYKLLALMFFIILFFNGTEKIIAQAKEKFNYVNTLITAPTYNENHFGIQASEKAGVDAAPMIVGGEYTSILNPATNKISTVAGGFVRTQFGEKPEIVVAPDGHYVITYKKGNHEIEIKGTVNGELVEGKYVYTNGGLGIIITGNTTGVVSGTIKYETPGANKTWTASATITGNINTGDVVVIAKANYVSPSGSTKVGVDLSYGVPNDYPIIPADQNIIKIEGVIWN